MIVFGGETGSSIIVDQSQNGSEIVVRIGLSSNSDQTDVANDFWRYLELSSFNDLWDSSCGKLTIELGENLSQFAEQFASELKGIDTWDEGPWAAVVMKIASAGTQENLFLA